MRVLWLDAEQNPWTEASGFTTIEDFGLRVDRVFEVAEAKSKFQTEKYDLVVFTAEANGALELLADTRRVLRKKGTKIIVCSWKMGRDDFKAHAKTGNSAHRYARLPMPPEAFLTVAAELLECSVEDLKLDRSEVVPDAAETIALETSPEIAAPQSGGELGDKEVLRKYLRMREEQLELIGSEREELQKDNRRLQKELHEMKKRLRDSVEERDQLERKNKQVESDRHSFEESLRVEQSKIEIELKEEKEKLKLLEGKLKEAEERNEELKHRVKKDVRRIRAHERDLEARMEILRKDSETLLAAREQKLLEQQRKIDALEFDLDQVQDNRVRAEMESERYLAKLSRVARALHIAVSVIEEDAAPDAELDEMDEQESADILQSNALTRTAAESAATTVFDTGALQPAPQAKVESESDLPSPNPEEIYAELAADGEPTRVVQVEDVIPFGTDGKQASG